MKEVLITSLVVASLLAGCDRQEEIFIRSHKAAAVEVHYRKDDPSSYLAFSENEIIKYKDGYLSSRDLKVIRRIYDSLPSGCGGLTPEIPKNEDIIFLVVFKDEGGEILRKDRYSRFSFRTTEREGKICLLSLQEGDAIRAAINASQPGQKP